MSTVQRGMDSDRPTGPIVATLIAIVLGAFALMVADQMANHSRPIEAWVYSMGKWIPGAVGSGPAGSLGPFSGKEAIALIVWLASWAMLLGVMRNATPSVAKWARISMIALILITLNFIDPLADFTFGWVKWL
jgi:hypothetical protein